jgi:hypothetical protein
VQSPAFVPVRKRRQIVRCFKTKRLGKANHHRPADSTVLARRAKCARS